MLIILSETFVNMLKMYFLIDNKKQENDLWECIRKYVSRVDEYEAYLKNIFEYFSQVYNIELVEWIITKK